MNKKIILFVFYSLNKMNKTNYFSILVGIVCLLVFIALIGSSVDAPVIRWPIEAFNGIAFTFAYLLSLSPILSYIAALLLFALIFTLPFFISNKILTFLLSKYFA